MREPTAEETVEGAEVVATQPVSRSKAAKSGGVKRKVAAKAPSGARIAPVDDSQPANALSARGKKAALTGKAKRVANPLSARAVESAKPTRAASVRHFDLSQAAKKAKVVPSRLNALRRQGRLPKGSHVKQGRSVLYTQEAIDAIVNDTLRPARAVAAATAGKRGGAKGARERKSAAGLKTGRDNNAVRAQLKQVVKDAEARAATYSKVAEAARAQLALLS